MTEKLSTFDPIRPMAPQVKWWIVGAVILVLFAWELIFHLALMNLPMVTGHRLDALVAGVLVTAVILAFFVLIQQYERQLAGAVQTLREKNEALQTLEAEHDLRLLNLARDLGLALVDITDRCEIALSLPESIDVAETLSAIKARAHEVYQIERSLLELEQEGTELAGYLPAILEGYQQHRETRSRSGGADE